MSTEDFTKAEEKLLDAVPDALEDGVALLEWWQAKDAKDDPEKAYDDYYEETETRNRPQDRSYGFFGKVELPSSRKKVTINGNVQEMFYDEPKARPRDEAEADKWMHTQIGAFILKYFMRISDFRQPEPAEENGDGDIAGFGYSQLYYQRKSGKRGKFKKAEQDKIVELTEFEKGDDPYEWIVLKNPIFGFGFDFEPLGPLVEELIGVSGPQVKLPAKVFNYLVISNAFVVNEPEVEAAEGDEDPVVGRYGFGYAFVNDPEPSVYGYGPGQLQPAFEQMIWEVRRSGKVSVLAAFVAQEPRGILRMSVDPMAWGFQFTKALGGEVPGVLQPVKRFWDGLPLTNMTFDPVLPTVSFLNLATLGQADRIFGLSKEKIIKQALFVHFLQHYNAILGSVQTWRQIKDWTAVEADLPKWVVSGRSS